ncbi:hypothetical protein Gotur_025908 [Gossypium turneri]
MVNLSSVLANCNDSAGKMLESMNQIRKKSISGFGDNKREDQELQQWISSVTFSIYHAELSGLLNLYLVVILSDSKGWFSLLKCGDLLVILSARNELDYGEEPSMSPRAPSQQQHSQPAMQFMNTGFMVSTGSSGQTAVQGTRPDHCDQQSKNLVFSNALSSPVRRSLQHYHIAQEGYCPNGGLPSGNGARNNEPSFLQNQTRDSNPLSSNDSSMDMHADSPSHESTY